MEELWKEMSLTSTPAALQYHLPAYSPAAYRDRAAYLAVPQAPRTPPHAPHTALTLSSSLEFTYLGHAASSGPPSNSTSSGVDSLHMPDPFGTGSSSDIFSFATGGNNNNNNRRVAVQAAVAVVGSDRRQRRMIKNRESAERSRARKQAYTNEVELELAELRRENAMLIKREEDFHVHARLALEAEVPDRSKLKLKRRRSAPPP